MKTGIRFLTSYTSQLASTTVTLATTCSFLIFVKAGVIHTDQVEQAMLKVDRRNYAPQNAYTDAPQPLGHQVGSMGELFEDHHHSQDGTIGRWIRKKKKGSTAVQITGFLSQLGKPWCCFQPVILYLHQATISAPHMHAHALELLAQHLQPGMRALDVGCGSGYLAAVMARMVGIEGQVVAIDYLSPLVALSLENLRKEDADLLESALARKNDSGQHRPWLFAQNIKNTIENVQFIGNWKYSWTVFLCRFLGFGQWMCGGFFALIVQTGCLHTCLPKAAPFKLNREMDGKALSRWAVSLFGCSGSDVSHRIIGLSWFIRALLCRFASLMIRTAEASPYDSIHVGAAAESVPEALLEQLKPGGRMVIPAPWQPRDGPSRVATCRNTIWSSLCAWFWNKRCACNLFICVNDTCKWIYRIICKDAFSAWRSVGCDVVRNWQF